MTKVSFKTFPACAPCIEYVKLFWAIVFYVYLLYEKFARTDEWNHLVSSKFLWSSGINFFRNHANKIWLLLLLPLYIFKVKLPHVIKLRIVLAKTTTHINEISDFGHGMALSSLCAIKKEEFTPCTTFHVKMEKVAEVFLFLGF